MALEGQGIGRGMMPHDPTASLQSLLLKGTIYSGSLVPLWANSRISLVTVGKLQSSEGERLAP